ncbi:MAG TPA: ABC transporter permease, partial [Cystobacter sp.]
MSFRPRRALAVFWKDFLDLRKNPALLLAMAALPMVLVVVPMIVVWTYVRDPNDNNLRVIALYYDPTLP